MATQKKSPTLFDRLPPQNFDAERSVLGCMLLNEEAVGAAVEILHDRPSEVFCGEAHQLVYGAILDLFRNSKPVDPITVHEQLLRRGVLEQAGGVAYIAELVGAVPTSANVEYYARIVLDTAILRRLISICTNVAAKAYDAPGDVNDLLDAAEQDIFAIAEKRQINPIHKVGDLLQKAIERIEEIIKSRTGITGVPTGFTKLDEYTSGFQPSDMVVIAARPSVGKTAFALNICANAAIHKNKRVLLFSLEMSREQLVQRLLCMEGQIDSRRLRTGFLAQSEFPKLTKAADKLSRAPIFIDDTPNIGVLDLRSKARRHAAAHGVDLIIVDYLQLMSGARRAESRQVEISEISRSIKGLARELGIPVVALSQLSREAEKDDTGMPKLAHLRESGAIEQDADVVIMLSRPPVHEQEQNPNLIILNLAKQRNGPTGKIELLFERNVQQFRNLTGEREAAPAPRAAYDVPEYVEQAQEAYEEDEGVPF
jgi:replicative DNA helicase